MKLPDCAAANTAYCHTQPYRKILRLAITPETKAYPLGLIANVRKASKYVRFEPLKEIKNISKVLPGACFSSMSITLQFEMCCPISTKFV